MTDEELKDNEEYLNALVTNQKELIRVLKELYNDIPEVKEFYETLISLNNLKSKIKTLKPKITTERQKRCSHPVWHLLSKPNNINDQTKLSCQCIECGKIETRLAYEFPREFIIDEDITYDSIKNIYELFKVDEEQEKEIAKKFVKTIKEEYQKSHKTNN